MLEANCSGSVNQTAKIIHYNSPQVQAAPGSSCLLPWKLSYPNTTLTLPETTCLYSAWNISSAAWFPDVPHLLCTETQCSAQNSCSLGLKWMIWKDRHTPMFSASTASESPLLACTNSCVGAGPGIAACGRVSTQNSVMVAIK